MSDCIRAVQHALSDHGFDPGGFDGIWGPKSQAALDRAVIGGTIQQLEPAAPVYSEGPVWYKLARAELGTVEWGDGSNPRVVAYYADAGFPTVTSDEVAWCAAFVGAMLKRAGQKPSGSLAARSYLDWGAGVSLDEARPGDICVFKRGDSAWQGHVAFFVERVASGLKVLGGNQRDSVSEAVYPRASLLGIRRPA